MTHSDDIQTILNKIEALEKKIARKKIQVIHYEAAKEAWERRTAKVPNSKDDLSTLMTGMDYVHFHHKKALKATYYIRRYNESLEELKSEFHRLGGEL